MFVVASYFDGALVSHHDTVEDLAKWARNFDEHPVGGDALATRILTRGRLTSGDSIPYAFGLSHNVFRGQPTIEHGGAYGGYRTQVLRFPVQRFAVLTLCNASSANVAQLSQRVAAAYLGDRLGPVTWTVSGGNSLSSSTVKLSRDQLAHYAGAYWDARNEVLRRIEVRDSALAVTATPILLLPTSETTFRATIVNATVAFAVNRDGGVAMEEQMPGADKATYRRMPAPKTDVRTLGEYAGDYVSDELDVTWHIEPKGEGLVIRRAAVPDVALQPAFAETFDSPVGVVRFVRANGRVTGLIIGAGRVTGFSFRRNSNRK